MIKAIGLSITITSGGLTINKLLKIMMNKSKIAQLVAKSVHHKITLKKTAYTKSEVDRIIKDDRIRIRISIANELRKIALKKL